MALYYKNRPSAATRITSSQADGSARNNAPTLSEFDKHCESLLSNDSEEGWASELRRYLGDMERDVKKDTDIVEWWQVSSLSPEIVTRHFSPSNRTMPSYT